ncbi:hypothetical protein MUP46_03065 [Patescibacteria group bacterium]|nr:hypothetical protein [Patescibacteria group bacterium]
MSFDPCKHQFNLLLTRVGEYFNPKEKNVSVLVAQAAEMFGFIPYHLTSEDADHLPAPSESGPFFKCPSCGNMSLVVEGLCITCKEAEGGKYKTRMFCKKCPFAEKTEKYIITVLTDLGHDFSLQTKASLGIKILKDPEK